jgi:hypothetical protein
MTSLPPALRKADDSLRLALMNAKPDDRLQAIVVLTSEPEGIKPAIDPGEYPTRAAYREAMIQKRAVELREAHAPTVKAIEKLGVVVRGGTLGRTIVLNGPARNLLEALGLPGIQAATLDQPMSIRLPNMVDG